MTIVRATFLAALLSCTFLVMASPASAAPVVVGPPGNAAANLQLDSDAAGDVHMVWHGQDGARARVAYASVSAAGAVSAPVYLSPAGQDSYDGRVAVAEDGTAHVTWSRFAGGWYVVEYVKVSPAGIAGPTLTLSSAGASSDSQRVAVDAAGNAHVIWVRYSGPSRVEHVAISPMGVPGTIQTLSDPSSAATYARLAVSASGTAHVAWLQADGPTLSARHRSVSPDGVAGSTDTLSAPGVSAYAPEMRVDGSGSLHLVWYRSGAGPNHVQYLRISAAGAIGPVLDVSPPGGNANEPQLAVSASGAVHVVWQRYDGSHYRAEYTTISASGVIAPPVLLSAPGAAAQQPQVGVDAAGAAEVVWTIFYGGQDYRVQTVTVSATGIAGAVRTISDSNLHGTDLHMDRRGIAHVAWGRYTNAAWIVEYERLAPAQSIAPSALSFATRAAADGPSAAQQVTVTNDAAATRAASVGRVTITGAGAAAFAVSTNTCTALLEPGATCTIDVLFDPAAGAAYAAELVAEASGPSSPLRVTLSGTGTVPPPAVPTPADPTPVDPTPDPDTDSGASARKACPRGTSASVRCYVITPAVRRVYGAAPGIERGLYIVGQARSERIVGTGLGDIIRAGAGRDTVIARGGNDSIWAGAGNDLVLAGVGSDWVDGSRGDDRLFGDDGTDKLFGGSGDDLLDGGLHRDSLWGGAGNDVLRGGAGPDTVMRGGAGRDVLVWEPR